VTEHVPAGRLVPRATYRIQLHPEYTFEDATTLVPYLADLGVSHLYLSPCLEAVPGSTHGYDVVDPTRIRGELGGRTGCGGSPPPPTRPGSGWCSTSCRTTSG
jgi:(1->4)-alpha-D-glucan 1-alpha-D-glucosylmutase